jgi:hypothetical protein
MLVATPPTAGDHRQQALHVSEEERRLVKMLQAQMQRVQQRTQDAHGFTQRATSTVQEQHERRSALVEQRLRSTMLAEGLQAEQAKSQRSQQVLLDKISIAQQELKLHVTEMQECVHGELLSQVQEEIAIVECRIAAQLSENVELRCELERLERYAVRPLNRSLSQGSSAAGGATSPHSLPTSASSLPFVSGAFDGAVAMTNNIAAMDNFRTTEVGGGVDEDEHDVVLSESADVSSPDSASASAGIASLTTTASNTGGLAGTSRELQHRHRTGETARSFGNPTVAARRRCGYQVHTGAVTSSASQAANALVTQLTGEIERLEAQLQREHERAQGLVHRSEILRTRTRQLENSAQQAQQMHEQQHRELQDEAMRRTGETRSLLNLAVLHGSSPRSVSRSGSGGSSPLHFDAARNHSLQLS